MNQIDGVPPAAAAGSFAAQRRRESRREEWSEQMTLAAMLNKYPNLGCTFWTSLENKPISRISGIFQKKRGVRSGIADVFVLYSGRPIFVELKSLAGVATKAQKQVRVELLSGRCHVVDGTKRTRCDDGTPPLKRGLPPSMEAAAAVRGPDAAASGAGAAA